MGGRSKLRPQAALGLRPSAYLIHPGTLEFRPVATEERLREAMQARGEAPGGYRWVEDRTPRQPADKMLRRLLVETGRGFDRTILKNVRAERDERTGQPVIHFLVDPAREAAWREFTRALKRQRLAILVGHQVVSAPVVLEELGPEGQISGLSAQDADDLVGWMKAPPLRVAVSVAGQERVTRKP